MAQKQKQKATTSTTAMETAVTNEEEEMGPYTVIDKLEVDFNITVDFNDIFIKRLAGSNLSFNLLNFKMKMNLRRGKLPSR